MKKLGRPKKEKTKKPLNVTIDATNRAYLDDMHDNLSINISHYVDKLITQDRERNIKK